MNILITSVGRRGYLVKYFKDALDGDGEVHVANSSSITPAFKYADKSVVTPLIYDKEYISFLKEYCFKNNIKLIISLFDIDLPVLSKSIKEFEDIGVKVIISDEYVTRVCNDKWRTYEFLKENNIDTAKTYLLYSDAIHALSCKEIEFPLIIKPRWGMGSIGVFEAENMKELEILYDKVKRSIMNSYLKYESNSDINKSILIQQKIKGQEYGVDIINDLEGNYINSIIKEKYAMRSGETDCAKVVECKDITIISKKLSERLKHIANLDVDMFIADNKVYVLEMNARFGGGYPFSHIAGVNLPRAIIKWAKQENVNESDLQAKVGIIAHKDLSIVSIKENS